MINKKNFTLNIRTKGEGDFINITSYIDDLIQGLKKEEGLVFIFLKSTTAGLALLEDEEGHLADLNNFLNKLIPSNKNYFHNKKWNDYNGHSHLKASLFQKHLIIPFSNGKLNLGTWQNIFLLEFDNKPRVREIEIKILKL